MGAAVEARDLRKRYGERTAVDGVSFAIAPGEAYGLVGPNGAGKTTTISMLAGLLQRDGGEVTVAGHDLDRETAAAKRAIGLVPQEIALYPDLTAKENLAFFGRLYGLDRAKLAERTAAVLELVGLADRGDERIDTFSGGMKRRINIAAGLLHEPSVLVLDEPTVGVDPQSRNAILEGVAALRDSGIAVLYTSHYMEEVERVCDRVGIIDEGRLVAEGTRRELVSVIGERDAIELAVDGDRAAAATAAAGIDGVTEASATEAGVRVLVSNGRAVLPRLLADVAAAGAVVNSVTVVEPDLEAVFLHLTGKALRDHA